MGLLSRIKEKKEQKKKAEQQVEQEEEVVKKITYDVNAPIEKYTTEQVLARIEEEMGEDASYQYNKLTLQIIENMELKYEGPYGSYGNLTFDYFINDFYKQAITLKAKKLLYILYKRRAKEGKETITKEGFEKHLEEITKFIENLAQKAENKQKNIESNAEEMKKIDEELGSTGFIID